MSVTHRYVSRRSTDQAEIVQVRHVCILCWCHSTICDPGHMQSFLRLAVSSNWRGLLLADPELVAWMGKVVSVCS